jgi:hypothetical protein
MEADVADELTVPRILGYARCDDPVSSSFFREKEGSLLK